MVEHGIILSGGLGTRLAPLTNYYNKQMIPLYKRFIIDYPIDTLKSMGVKNLTVILGGEHFNQIISHLKDGDDIGLNINYIFQKKPAGIAQAINLAKDLMGNNKFAVSLGDNFFENPISLKNSNKAQIMLYKHQELNRFGVASLKDNEIIKIEEKPKVIDNNFDNYAITGCYVFDSMFFEYFKSLKPSHRNEFEIVDIIQHYLDDNNLDYTMIDGLWSDAGTHDAINYLNNYLYLKEKGIK